MNYDEVIAATNEVLEQYREATVRQIYYRLISPPYQLMENTRSMYTSFDKMLTKAREHGDIDWRKLADHTRQARKADEGYSSPEAFMAELKRTLEGYERNYTEDMWQEQDYALRVFVEKDALADLVASVALSYQVDVIPGRGYNSFTQLASLAEELAFVDKPIIILYFGDFDPSGLDIDRSARSRLEAYSGRDVKFIRCALTEDDIASLPANPTKSADTRSESYREQYGDRCWELDALPPDELQARVREAIVRFIDKTTWQESLEHIAHGREQVHRELSHVLNF